MCLFLLTGFSILSASAQDRRRIQFVNGTFPESWDFTRTLRGAHTQVLAWIHRKWRDKTESKIVLLLNERTNDTGDTSFTISKMISDTKPFNTWNHTYIHFGPDYTDTTIKIGIGYFDMHTQSFNHRPTETELYTLLNRWRLGVNARSTILTAGIDETLWLSIFGWRIDKKQLASW